MTRADIIQDKVAKARELVNKGSSQVKAAETVGISAMTLGKYLKKRPYTKRAVAQIVAVPAITKSSDKVMVFYGTPSEVASIVRELA
jgi:predicted transcriptional regulator